jgi:hypothetical protein
MFLKPVCLDYTTLKEMKTVLKIKFRIEKRRLALIRQLFRHS